MRKYAIAIVIGLLACTTAVEAKIQHPHQHQAHAAYAASGWGWGGDGAAQVAHREQGYGRATVARYGASVGNLPAHCYAALSHGTYGTLKPCGCFAEWLLTGHTEHVLNGVNMWLASAWLAFQRVPAGPGTAAVMRGHVVAILADNGDGTVRAHDSWGIHNMSKRRVIAFVDPRQRHYAAR